MKPEDIGRAAGAAVLGLVALLLLHRTGHWLHAGWMVVLAWPATVTAVLFGWLRWRRRAFADPSEGGLLPGVVLVGALVLYLFSSAALYGWFYFLGWPPPPGLVSRLLTSWPARFALLTALLTPVFFLSRGRAGRWLLALLLLAQVICLAQFLASTGGAPLYRDDHPSFMQRLWVLARVFPKLAYYDPFWNGGKAAPYLVITGSIPIGAVLWPAWRWGSMLKVYTPALAAYFIVFVPWLAFAGARIARLDRPAALAAALLSLGVSQSWFLWFLHFGTVGASSAIPFVLLVCAALYAALSGPGPSWKTGLVLVPAVLLFLAWPPSAIISVPVALAAFVALFPWNRRRFVFLALCALAIAVLYLPYLSVTLRYSNVAKFSQAGGEALRLGEAMDEGLSTLQEQLWQGNPVVLFLGMAGVWFLGRGMGRFYGVAMILLLLLASFGELWKPQFQLNRAGIPLFFVAVVPAAAWAGRLLDSRSAWLAPVRAALFALLMLTSWHAGGYYANKAPAPYRVMTPEIPGLVDWIRANTPENARVLFAGPTVHAYGKGHVAFLPILTDREMMACDYYHFMPGHREYEYPPGAFHDSEESVFRFLDLYNVSHVITYHPRWIRFFDRRPDVYERVHTFGARTKKNVYRVKRDPDWFLEGSGEVEADVSVWHVRLDDPEQEVVLKYNWAEGLTADPPVTLCPRDVEEGIRFIAVQPNGRTAFDIRFGRWF